MPKVPLSAVDGATGTLLCQWVGPGGDSLGIGHGAIWLTDYDAGTVSRIDLNDVRTQCICLHVLSSRCTFTALDSGVQERTLATGGKGLV